MQNCGQYNKPNQPEQFLNLIAFVRHLDQKLRLKLAIRAAILMEELSNRGRRVVPNYSETLMDHFNFPRNSGSLELPDAIGFCGSPDSSPFMLLHLTIADDKIADARYRTHGCGPLIASGSAMTQWIKGKSVAECLEFNEPKLVEILDGIPDEKRWCPILAIKVLHAALENYCDRRQGSVAPSPMS